MRTAAEDQVDHGGFVEIMINLGGFSKQPPISIFFLVDCQCVRHERDCGDHIYDPSISVEQLVTVSMCLGDQNLDLTNCQIFCHAEVLGFLDELFLKFQGIWITRSKVISCFVDLLCSRRLERRGQSNHLDG